MDRLSLTRSVLVNTPLHMLMILCRCSGELLHEGKLISVVLKEMEVTKDRQHEVEQQARALYVVRGHPHIIQQIHPKYHRIRPGLACIVTRCALNPLSS